MKIRRYDYTVDHNHCLECFKHDPTPLFIIDFFYRRLVLCRYCINLLKTRLEEFYIND